MKRASGSTPEARGVLAVDHRLPPLRRRGVAVDGGRFAVGTVVGTVIWTVVRSMVRSVMGLSAVAVAARLLVAGVDVSAAGADAAREQGAVVVFTGCVAAPAQNQWARGQDTATDWLSMQRVSVPAPAAGVVIAGSPLGEAALVQTRISHHGRMRTVAESPCVPVHVRRPRGPSTTALNASEAIALVDPAERPREIEHLIVDRIANGGRAIRAMVCVMGTRAIIVVTVLMIAVPISMHTLLTLFLLVVTVIANLLFAFVTLHAILIAVFPRLRLAVARFALTRLIGPQYGATSSTDNEG